MTRRRSTSVAPHPPHVDGEVGALPAVAVESVLVGALVVLVLLLTRGHVIDQPPVWDGAMGLTPAALTLAESGFDLPDLLRQDRYLEGGPNTHATSLIALTTAAIIRLAGSYGDALPLLHVVSLCVAGILAAGVYTLVRSALLPRGAAWLAAALTMLYPATVVQASDVYLDLPLAAAVIWALVFTLRSRYGWAVAAACLAVWIKPTGAALVPAIAYMIATDREVTRRHWPTLGALVIPGSLTAAIFLVTRSRAAADDVGHAVYRIVETAIFSASFALWHPAFLILLCSTVAALIAISISARKRGGLPDPIERGVTLMGVALIATVAFFTLNAAITTGFYLLPRYTVAVAPMMIVLVIIALSLIGRRASLIGGVLLAGAFVVVMPGVLPDTTPILYPVSEADLTYERHIDVQRRALAELEALAERMPVYYDHFAYFAFEYPEMGWTQQQPVDGTPVFLTDDPSEFRLDRMPPEFALLYESQLLGGDILDAIWAMAEQSSAHDVEVKEFRDGRITNYVVVVRRVDKLNS